MVLLKRRARSLCIALSLALASLVSWLAPGTPAHADARVLKGPYLMDVQPDSIAVLVELSEPEGLTITASTPDGVEAPRLERSAARLHEVVLRGLRPATAYRYLVTLPVGESIEGHFTTAPPPGTGRLRFIAYGDTRTDAVSHAAIVDAIRSQSPDFIVHTGDLVENGGDERMWQGFFDVSRALLRDVPLFPAPGNHDERGELELYRRYMRTPKDPEDGGELYYAFTYGAVRFFMLHSTIDWTAPTPQRPWLEREIERARRDPRVQHVIAVMHHGPYSSGYHGKNDSMLEAGLDQLFRRNGVLVIGGHDHMYERGEARGLKYIVTGGGGAPLYGTNRHLPSQLAFEAAYHYVRVEVRGPEVVTTALRPDGTVIDRCRFVGRGGWDCPGWNGVIGGPPGLGRIANTNQTLLGLGLQAGWLLWGGAFAALVVLVLVFFAFRRRSRGRAASGSAPLS